MDKSKSWILKGCYFGGKQELLPLELEVEITNEKKNEREKAK